MPTYQWCQFKTEQTVYLKLSLLGQYKYETPFQLSFIGHLQGQTTIHDDRDCKIGFWIFLSPDGVHRINIDTQQQ
jgi:hypothetical protein